MNVNFKYFGKTHSLFISENVYWNWTSLEKLDLSYNCYQFMKHWEHGFCLGKKINSNGCQHLVFVPG